MPLNGSGITLCLHGAYSRITLNLYGASITLNEDCRKLLKLALPVKILRREGCPGGKLAHFRCLKWFYLERQMGLTGADPQGSIY